MESNGLPGVKWVTGGKKCDRVKKKSLTFYEASEEKIGDCNNQGRLIVSIL